jgi:hypothetical protein
VRSFYSFGCGSASPSVDCTAENLRYDFFSTIFLHSTYFEYLFVANCEYFTHAWGFIDAKSLLIVPYRWQKIVNVTGTVKGRYMLYTNALDCITQRHVRFKIVLL